MTIRVFEVGGAVRDELLGVPSKDIDFAVEAPSFEAMTTWLLNEGFEIFLSTEEFFTVRARFPRDTNADGRAGMTADFVLCRKDGPSTDGRRPDFVEPGTIEDDLARRDFTINAIAKLAAEQAPGEPTIWAYDTSYKLLDPHSGILDLSARVLRFVGDPMERLREDGLRALRSIRFLVTKGFVWDDSIQIAMRRQETARLLRGVSPERIREELHKAFKHDTLATLAVLQPLETLTCELFKNGLWLEPTLKS